jgi:superfamily I DNA/RNA helicase
MLSSTELDFLKKLLKSDIKKCLAQADDSQILILVEICYNIIKFRYSLSTKQLKALYPFAENIRQIAKKRNRKQAEHLLLSLPKIFYSKLIAPLLLKNEANDLNSRGSLRRSSR